MHDFEELLRTPHVGRIIAAQLAARFPAGMYSLGLLFHIEQRFSSYASAGLTLAAFSISMAIVGPIIARQLTRFGTFPILLSTLLISASCFALLAVARLPLAGVLALAVLAGATTPPVVPVANTLYPQLVPRRLVNSLFSLDAAVQEIIWVIGPLLVTSLIVATNTTRGLLVIVAIQVIGGIAFTLEPKIRQLAIPPSQHRFGRVLTSRKVAALVAVSLLLFCALAAAEVAVVGIFGQESLEVGLVLAVCSLGSVAGGFLVAHRKLTSWSLACRVLVVAVGIGLALVLSGAIGLSAAFFVAGLGTAPALAAVSTTIATTVDSSDSAEAYSWIGTGQLVGEAAGAACAGLAVDAFAGAGGLTASLSFALLGVAVATLFRPRRQA